MSEKGKKKNPIRYFYVFSEYPETSLSSFYEELMQLFIYFLNTFASLNYEMRDALKKKKSSLFVVMNINFKIIGNSQEFSLFINSFCDSAFCISKQRKFYFEQLTLSEIAVYMHV